MNYTFLFCSLVENTWGKSSPFHFVRILLFPRFIFAQFTKRKLQQQQEHEKKNDEKKRTAFKTHIRNVFDFSLFSYFTVSFRFVSFLFRFNSIRELCNLRLTLAHTKEQLGGGGVQKKYIKHTHTHTHNCGSQLTVLNRQRIFSFSA